MTMDYQFWGTILLLILAVSYCALRIRKSWNAIKAGGCSSSCGCPTSRMPTKEQPGLVQVEDLTARLRLRTLNRN